MERHAAYASHFVQHAFEFFSAMSFWVARNIGARRIAKMLTLLNEGSTLSDISLYLGVSISRASRIVRALFKRVYVPHQWTIDAATYEMDSKLYESKEIEEICEDNLTRAKEYAETLKNFRDPNSGNGSLRKSQKVVTTGK